MTFLPANMSVSHLRAIRRNTSVFRRIGEIRDGVRHFVPLDEEALEQAEHTISPNKAGAKLHHYYAGRLKCINDLVNIHERHRSTEQNQV